jgi:hypothetical protein
MNDATRMLQSQLLIQQFCIFNKSDKTIMWLTLCSTNQIKTSCDWVTLRKNCARSHVRIQNLFGTRSQKQWKRLHCNPQSVQSHVQAMFIISLAHVMPHPVKRKVWQAYNRWSGVKHSCDRNVPSWYVKHLRRVTSIFRLSDMCFLVHNEHVLWTDPEKCMKQNSLFIHTSSRRKHKMHICTLYFKSYMQETSFIVT